jgi:hypothetical protein
VASGIGLIAGVLAYLISGRVAVSALLFFATICVGGAVSWQWCAKRFLLVPPWISFSEWREQYFPQEE